MAIYQCIDLIEEFLLDFPSLNHVINKANFFCLFHTLNITKINKKQIKNLNINKIKTKHFCNGLM